MKPEGAVSLHDPVDITWLGQAGFLVRSPAIAVAIDPFFSEHEARLYPPPTDDVFGDHLDYLLVTHEHGDHLDVELMPRLVNRFADLNVVVPTPLIAKVHAIAPAAKVSGLQPGDSLAAGDLTIHAIGAIHAIAMADGYSDGRQSDAPLTPFLGYVLEYPGTSIYHAGDTLVSKEIVEDLARRSIDVAVLPVNGRDYFREQAGIVGNLSAREAVELAAACGASCLIPMHHDLIRGNTERAGACADVAVERQVPLHVINLARFQSFRLPIRTT